MTEIPHYAGHRKRLKQRFLAEPKALADYELLEMILFPAKPMGDVKPLAKALLARFGSEFEEAEQNMELAVGASPTWDHAAFLAARQTPVFFGSGVNNFGVMEVLDALVDLAPPPQPRVEGSR